MIRIINDSDYKTATWVDFKPKKGTKPESLKLSTGQIAPVIPSPDGIYSARVTLEPRADLFAQELDSSIPYKFKLSDWIADDIAGLIPEIHVEYESTFRIIKLTNVNLVLDTEAVKVYELEGHINGWKARISISIYSEQDVAEFQLQIKWSDRGSPSWFTSLKSLRLYSKEEYFVDYGKKLGVSYSKQFDVYCTELFNSTGTQIGDGQPLNFRGAIFCRPTWMNNPAIREKMSPEAEHQFLMFHQHRFENFEARKEFPVVAMADHAGNYGPANTKIKMWEPGTEEMEIDARVLAFRSQMLFPGSHFDLRFYSNTPNTGGTGDQIVFGAVKDAAALLAMDGRFLHVLGYHHTYPMRPFHWHELNGKELKAKDHPNCTTWNLIPDHRLGSDMLGKPRTWAPSNFAGGYNGPDEEHHQQLYETFAASLRREPILKWSFESLIEASLMMKKGRMGAPRAIGRQLDTWMEILSILPHRAADIQSLIRDKVSATKAQWSGKFVTGPVKPLNTVNANGRGLINYDYWVPWEHGLFSIGAYKYLVNNNDPEFRQIVLDVTRSVVEYGFIPINGRYSVATCVRWFTDGSPLTITDVSSQVGTGNDKEVRLDSNMLRWTLPALVVHILLDGPSKAKAREILNQFEPLVSKSRDSEWLSLGDWSGLGSN